VGWVRSSINEMRRAKARLGGGTTTLRLPSGETVTYADWEALDAFQAWMADEEHWLLPYLYETQGSTGMEGLIRALQRSQELAEEEEDPT
jgi:hypothetical protein